MRFVLVAMMTVFASAAMAQQPVPLKPVPLTDWRASIDGDLSKLAMPRDAHASIFNILQAYERQAQMEKARQQVPPTEAPK